MAQQHIDAGEEPDTSRWPTGVRPITVEQLGYIGVDSTGGLYWDGKPVEVRKRLDLSWPEKTFAIIVGLATIAGSVGAVAQGWAAAHQWSCQIGLVAAWCQAPVSSASPVVPAPQKHDR